MRHYALIPAKSKSLRCLNKNWRDFIAGRSLVDFTLDTVPTGIFERVIVSTDKDDYKIPAGVTIHRRQKKLAGKDSCVKDLISLIIGTYALEDRSYLWLLNPTAPFRRLNDYMKIKGIIERDAPPAVVSAVSIIPYIWKNSSPIFTTQGKRRNTEDFKDEYAVENGMFYAMNTGYFRKHKSWYGKGVRLYRQADAWASVDIDTEEDFAQAKRLEVLWPEKRRVSYVRP